MKRVLFWIILVSSIALIFSMGLMGVKILTHDYDFIAEGYVALVSWILLMGSIIIWRFSRKCPHCHRVRQPGGPYCPYCGKKYEA